MKRLWMLFALAAALIPIMDAVVEAAADPHQTMDTAALTATPHVRLSAAADHVQADHEPLTTTITSKTVTRVLSETTTSTTATTNETTDTILEDEVHAADAVLFPSFCVTIGAIVYIALTRITFLSHVLPYTAIMFLIGTIMGIATTMLSTQENKLHESVQLWTDIDSEVLLLVFLPGLIFKDALGLNVHLFRVSIWQTLTFAVPLVLAGTTLTACVAYYIFPYNWSFNLCMTFGSILSATDPVAVAALLNELGAPPRLKIHISGEALLNDGSAIVFYSIFVLRYLYELGIDGVGEDVGVARGVALFFQKSLGGVAVGLFFGFGILIMLKVLNRRFSREESVTEVASVLGLAYANYFVADYVWKTSGVIATVTAGVTVKYLGRAIVNDEKLLNDFWGLLEHVLNTVLFTLGGVVWGDILVDGRSSLGPSMWGYLVLLYVMLTIIRSALFFLIYPLTSRIGLGTSWQETLFQIHGGLRGAVGIALALSLDSEVGHIAAGGEVDPFYQAQTRQVFGLVGGIAFMTLVINAPTSKPLLKYLQLSESTESRKKILDTYRIGFRRHAIQEMVRLLSRPRFVYVNFAVIKSHVPFLADLTRAQLMEAVERHRETTPRDEYQAPHLERILPYLAPDTTFHFAKDEQALEMNAPSTRDAAQRARQRRRRKSTSTLRFMMQEAPKDVKEFRLLFLSILRSAYEEQIAVGELAERSFMAISLEQSLDLAIDNVSKGEPLRDWDHVNLVSPAIYNLDRKFRGSPRVFNCLDKFLPGTHEKWSRGVKRLKIERALAYMAAHQYSRDYFKREFEDVETELSEAGKMVIAESETQSAKAENVLKKHDTRDVETVVSHKFCSILLSSSILYIGWLVNRGFLKEDEAEHWVQDIEQELDRVHECCESHGENELVENMDIAFVGIAE